jgi:hypothetical protein
MPITYEPITTTTLGSAAASITLSSIPATYTDLRLVVNVTMATGTTCRYQFNGDTSTNYSTTYLLGDGSSASSGAVTNGSFIYASQYTASTTIPSFYSMDVFSYAGSTYKTVLTTGSNDRNGSGAVDRQVQLWRSTSAITSINIFSTGTFATGTTATLYGIKNA